MIKDFMESSNISYFYTREGVKDMIETTEMEYGTRGFQEESEEGYGEGEMTGKEQETGASRSSPEEIQMDGDDCKRNCSDLATRQLLLFLLLPLLLLLLLRGAYFKKKEYICHRQNWKKKFNSATILKFCFTFYKYRGGGYIIMLQVI